MHLQCTANNLEAFIKQGSQGRVMFITQVNFSKKVIDVDQGNETITLPIYVNIPSDFLKLVDAYSGSESEEDQSNFPLKKV